MVKIKPLSVGIRVVIAIFVLVLFLFIGGIYGFAPSEILQKYNIDFGMQRTGQIIIAIIFVIVGVILFLSIILTDALKKFRHFGRKYWYLFIIFDMAKWLIIFTLIAIIVFGGSKVIEGVI